MASNRLKSLISEVEDGATILAELSTQLSKQIQSFEALLNRLPGKVAVRVPAHTGEALILARSSPESWSLYFAAHAGAEPIRLTTNASIEMKVKSVALFEPLVQHLSVFQRVKIAELKIACDTMSRLAEQLQLGKAEGQ